MLNPLIMNNLWNYNSLYWRIHWKKQDYGFLYWMYFCQIKKCSPTELESVIDSILLRSAKWARPIWDQNMAQLLNWSLLKETIYNLQLDSLFFGDYTSYSRQINNTTLELRLLKGVYYSIHKRHVLWNYIFVELKWFFL